MDHMTHIDTGSDPLVIQIGPDRVAADPSGITYLIAQSHKI